MYVYLYLWLSAYYAQNTRGILARRGPEVYVPGYIRAFFQLKTEQIQERQDETLILNSNLSSFHNFSSTNHHESFRLFSENRNPELVGHQDINWHDYVYLCCIMLVVLKETIFSERPRTGVKGVQIPHRAWEEVRLTEIFFKLPWKRKREENPLNWVWLHSKPSE